MAKKEWVDNIGKLQKQKRDGLIEYRLSNQNLYHK